jgi:tetratricopeptide (TPR) repeat protein
LKRLEQDYEREWPGLVEDAMTFVWASRRGLSEEELLDLLGTGGNQLPVAQWVQFYSAVENLYVNRSGLIGFAHNYVREAIQDRYLRKEESREDAHERLADYFSELELNPRKVDELPWQLAEAESWQRLYDLLADLDFFSIAWQEDQYEAKRYWAKIESSSPLLKLDAYQMVLKEPEGVSDSEKVKHLSNLLNDMGHPMEALSLRQFLADCYRQNGDHGNFAKSLRAQAVIHLKRGDLDKAMVLLKEAERICRELGDHAGLSACLGNQASIFHDRGDLDGAMELHKKQERICRELSDPYGIMESLNNQGLIHMARGDLVRAMTLLKEAELICRDLGVPGGLRGPLNNQANILCARGDLDGAMALLKEMERICRDIGDQEGLHFSLGNQAGILWDRGDLDGAMGLLKEQERICRKLDNPAGLLLTLNNQAIILMDRGDLDNAMELLKEQEHICRELGDPGSLAHSLASQAEVLAKKGQPQDARKLAEEACRLAEEHGYARKAELFKTILAEIHIKLGDLGRAMELLKEQEDFYSEGCDLDDKARWLSCKAEAFADMGQTKEALPLAEEAYELATKHCFVLRAKEIKPILGEIRSQLE